MSIFHSRYKQIVNEVYFGETSGIQEIQKQLSKFRSKYIGQMFNSNINIDPDLQKLNRMFEKEFGFGVFTLKIGNFSQYNAMTLPLGKRLDLANGETDDNLFASKSGFKYNPKVEYACIVFIFSGIICSSKFTDREVLAVILHEVGHNFSGAISKSIGILDNVYRAFSFISLFLTFCFNPIGAYINFTVMTNSGIKSLISLDEDIKKNSPGLGGFLRNYYTILGMIKSFMGEVNFIKNIILTPTVIGAVGSIVLGTLMRKLISYAFNPALIMRDLSGYPDEQLSDEFAALYGYGPDLASALSKLEHGGGGLITADAVDKIPVIGQLFNMIWLVPELLVRIFDVHPVLPARIKSELNVLEAELQKDDLDPKMKARISSDISKINKVYNESVNIRNQSKLDPYIIKKAYYTFLFEKMGGDIKHLIFKQASPEAIDQGYQSAIKNVKMR